MGHPIDQYLHYSGNAKECSALRTIVPSVKYSHCRARGQHFSLLFCLGGTPWSSSSFTPRGLIRKVKTQRKSLPTIYFHTTFHTISTIHNGFLFYVLLFLHRWRLVFSISMLLTENKKWKPAMHHCQHYARLPGTAIRDLLHRWRWLLPLLRWQASASPSMDVRLAIHLSDSPSKISENNLKKAFNFYSRIYDTRSPLASHTDGSRLDTRY